MFRIIVFVLFAVVSLSVPAQYRSSGARWENVDGYQQDFQTQTMSRNVDDEEPGVEIALREGYVYVTTDHTIQVKVVSVLGAPVSDAVLEPGTFRLPLRSRGIYIVRAGKSVRRMKIN